MRIVLAILFVIGSIAAIVLWLWNNDRLRQSLMSSQEVVPDDLRRADDGLDGTGGGGPGIGPFFPTN